jgi:hypothetical protein
MIFSLESGQSSGMMSCPASPRIKRRPRGPLSPIPRPESLFLLRVSSREERVDRSGR